MPAKSDRNAVREGLADILGDVIQGDRRRAGRPVEDTPGSAAGPSPAQEATGRTDNLTNKQADNMTSQPGGTQTDKPAESRAGKAGTVNTAELLRARVAEAETMMQGPTVTVTLRMPAEMNRWLDECVHLAWPERVRKQELVLEALRLLFARRGRAGEPVLATDLLGRKGR